MAVETTTTMIQAHDNRITVKTPLSPPEVTTVNVSVLPITPQKPALSTYLHSLHLLAPENITTDFDALRFEAAAHDQLVFHDNKQPLPHQPAGDSSAQPPTPDQQVDNTVPHSDQTSSSTHLISSPYNIPHHYLDLSSPHLTTPSRLLALALTALKPATHTYATAPYEQALNFASTISLLRDVTQREKHDWKETSFYVVVFRSQLKEGIDEEWLYRLDEESHREACESGGLLKYWFGKGDGERRNLATCFWHSREDAYKGGLGPWHRKARAAGRELYESIVFSTHRFTVTDGVEGYSFEEWKG
ncbi:hypothetical protein G6011_09325 [Alternaria panax]|uniref:Uncharacterized protein n=1 Tax=Alternaria panax TaxID=48097 RepID=A0AAD4IB41_9PLEO|nr:hypothetical protein G6011_09325 [Alternaria panax]